MLQKGVDEVGEDDGEWEPVELITSPCDNVSGCWGLSAEKPVWIGNPVPLPSGRGGGARFLTQHQSHDTEMEGQHNIRDQADPARCYKFHILQTNLQYTIFYNIILWLGKTTNFQDQFPTIHSTMWRNCVFILEHMVWVHANTGNALVALGIWLPALKNVYTGIISKLKALQHGCTVLCERRHCIRKSKYRLRNVHTLDVKRTG